MRHHKRMPACELRATSNFLTYFLIQILPHNIIPPSSHLQIRHAQLSQSLLPQVHRIAKLSLGERSVALHLLCSSARLRLSAAARVRSSSASGHSTQIITAASWSLLSGPPSNMAQERHVGQRSRAAATGVPGTTRVRVHTKVHCKVTVVREGGIREL